MIRNLLATTALAALIATGANAQNNSTTTTDPAAQPAAPATQDATGANTNAAQQQLKGHLASNLIGENVYNGTGDNAEHIGDVNDLVLSMDGKVESIVVGVGGFLGIGEKNVAIEFSQAQWADRNGDQWLVVPMTKDQLQAQADFDRTPYEPAPANMAAADNNNNNQATGTAAGTGGAADTMAAAPADNQTTQQGGTDQTATAAIDRSQLKEVGSDIRAEDLVGTIVYGAEDANVGEIGDVILTADGKVDAYIIDVGGFLGMGEKEVAIGADNLTFMQDANGNKYLYTDFTKEQLDAQQAYDEASYAQNRDQQRLTIAR